jgi:ketosteroid isomerase-like protein
MARSDADALNATMVEGLAKGDAAMVASVYAPDARLLPPGMDVQTDGDIQRYWQGAVEAGLRHGRIETVNYEEHDGLAVEEGRWELRASVDTPVVDAGKFLIVHKRQADGSWKYAFDMFNSSLAATKE